MQKKKWQKPSLVVLVRGEAEESVLAACKNRDARTGTGNMEANCCNAGMCQANCSAISAS
jgi:hypothetical protein